MHRQPLTIGMSAAALLRGDCFLVAVPRHRHVNHKWICSQLPERPRWLVLRRPSKLKREQNDECGLSRWPRLSARSIGPLNRIPP